MQRPRVLIDGRILAYRRGGIPRYVQQLTRRLPATAPDLVFRLVVNRAHDEAGMVSLRVRTPPHHRFERIALGVELMARRPALIHSPDFIPPATPTVPRVVTIHDLAFLDDPSLLADDARRYYAQVVETAHQATRIIAVSDTMRQVIIDRLRIPPVRVVTIHNGVDERFFEPVSDSPERYPLGSGLLGSIADCRPVILMVGTVEPRKRQLLIVETLEELARRGSSLAPVLVVAGQRGWRCDDVVAALDRLSDTGSAFWLPDVDDSQLALLYREATLLAFPSLDEGFGLPAAEAMASGLPVVAARRGALPEIVGDAGILVDDDSPSVWADALEAVLGDVHLRERMSRRGQQLAERFRWSRAAAETVQVYREVLQR